jgi:hypothetical protein
MYFMQATRKKGQYRRPPRLKSGQIRNTLRDRYETSTSVVSRPQGSGKVAAESVIVQFLQKSKQTKSLYFG